MSEGEIEAEQKGEPKPKEGIRLYDLAKQDRIMTGSMPALELICERFSRLIKNSLCNMLNKGININFVKINTLKFGEFMKNLSLPSSIHVMKMEPLRGQALVVLDSKLVFLLVNCFFGGDTASKEPTKVEEREFTAIENKIIRRVVDNLLREWGNSWHQVYEIKTRYLRYEANPRFVSIVAPSDVVLEIRFAVAMEDFGGTVLFCIPYSSIEPIRSKLQSRFQADQLEVDQNWMDRLKKRLGETTVEVSVELGKSTILGKDLINLNLGDTILLNTDRSEPLIVKVEGVPKFKAQCGIHRGNLAIKLRKTLGSSTT